MEKSEGVTIHDAVKLLREINAADPVAFAKLINHRVECNDALASHPTIPVGVFPGGNLNKVTGLLGIINGLFSDPVDSIGIVYKDQDGAADGLIDRIDVFEVTACVPGSPRRNRSDGE